jgi:hypothetical protein
LPDVAYEQELEVDEFFSGGSHAAARLADVEGGVIKLTQGKRFATAVE